LEEAPNTGQQGTQGGGLENKKGGGEPGEKTPGMGRKKGEDHLAAVPRIKKAEEKEWGGERMQEHSKEKPKTTKEYVKERVAIGRDPRGKKERQGTPRNTCARRRKAFAYNTSQECGGGHLELGFWKNLKRGWSLEGPSRKGGIQYGQNGGGKKERKHNLWEDCNKRKKSSLYCRRGKRW